MPVTEPAQSTGLIWRGPKRFGEIDILSEKISLKRPREIDRIS